ncbi:MAG: AAA family ATPase [Cyclobacteriaceae bacterium]
MKTILILRGLPASGKSTYAKQLVKENPGIYKRINRDELREMLDGYDLTGDNEKFVKKTRDLLITQALEAGKSVIVDDTNLSEKNIKRIQQLADIYKKKTGNTVAVEVKEFTVELEEAIARDSKRARPVGKKVIKTMYDRFYGKVKPNDERGPHYVLQDAELPHAIICDIDGTLAIIKDRSPFDAAKCENDLLNEPIAEIVKTYKEKDTTVILLSGRQDQHRDQTVRWLETYSIPYDKLLMRKTGDNRKDAIIKKEITESEILGKFFVKFVLDDRDQVVEMWRKDIGFACLQVNYGDF